MGVRQLDTRTRRKPTLFNVTLRLVIARAVRGFYPKRMGQRQVYYRKMDISGTGRNKTNKGGDK